MKEESSPSLTSDGFYFHSTFENGTDGWTAVTENETCKIASTKDASYKGNRALSVMRKKEILTSGIQRTLNTTSQFLPGKTYSFSVMIMPTLYATGKLTLEYTNLNGKNAAKPLHKVFAKRGNGRRLKTLHSLCQIFPASIRFLCILLQTQLVTRTAGLQTSSSTKPSPGQRGLSTRRINRKIQISRKKLYLTRLNTKMSYHSSTATEKVVIWSL